MERKYLYLIIGLVIVSSIPSVLTYYMFPRTDSFYVNSTVLHGKYYFDVLHSKYFNESVGFNDSVVYVLDINTNSSLMLSISFISETWNGSVVNGKIYEEYTYYKEYKVWHIEIEIKSFTEIYIFNLHKDVFSFNYAIYYMR